MIITFLTWIFRKKVKKGRQIEEVPVISEKAKSESIDVYDGVPIEMEAK